MQILLNFLTNAIKFSDAGKKIVLRLALMDVQDVSEKIDNRNEIPSTI